MGANGFRKIVKENTALITIRNISIKTSAGKLYLPFSGAPPSVVWNVVTKEYVMYIIFFQNFLLWY